MNTKSWADKTSCPLTTVEFNKFAKKWIRITKKLKRMYGDEQLRRVRLAPRQDEEIVGGGDEKEAGI